MAETLFKSKIAVWRHLVDVGWLIGKSQFYKHCNERLLRPNDEGKFTLKTVNRYAKKYLKEKATGRKVKDKLDRMQEEKLELEVKRERTRVEREQYDLDLRQGKYMARDEVEAAIVGRAVAFMAHLNHAVQKNVPDWIDLVGGEQRRAADLVADISQVIEQRMSDFSADFEVEILLEANVGR